MIVRLALMVGLAFAAGAPILRSYHHILPRGANAFTSVAFGLVIMTFTAALAWYVGIRPEYGIAVIAAAGLGLTLFGLRRSFAEHKQRDSECRLAGSTLVSSAVIVTVYAAATLIASAWMGAGRAPAVFFNVDTPYYLSHVHALIRSDSFPPSSLNVHGVVQAYHYGVQLSAALIARLTNLSAHAALFWIVTPLLLIAKIAVAWRLATLVARRGGPHWLAMLCLLFLVEYPISADEVSRLVRFPTELGWIVEKFLVLERFDTGFPLLSTLAGSFLVYLIALFMLDVSLPNRHAGLIIAVACLPLFKAPYLVPVAVWLGSWALYHLLAERQFRPLLTAAGGLLLSAAVIRLTLRSGYSFASALAPTSLDTLWRTKIANDTVPYFGLVLSAVACVGILRGLVPDRISPAAGSDQPIVFLVAAAVIVALPIVLPVTYMDPEGHSQMSLQTLQWLTPARWIVAVAVTLAVGKYYAPLKRWRKAVFCSVIIALVSFPVIGKVRDGVFTVWSPRSWHEFADNTRMIRALAPISVQGAMIVTNDLRYPANDYARDHRQLQIASLFGHQAYGAATRLDHARDGSLRVQEQELLRQPNWTESLSSIACRRGWTHVLVRRAAPHVQSVPGLKIYEDDQYTTFELAPCGTPVGQQTSPQSGK